MGDKIKVKRKIENKLIGLLNRAMAPVAYTYMSIGRFLIKSKKIAPEIYNALESLLKSHVVTIGKRDKSVKNINIDKFSNIITSNIIRNLPNIGEEKLNEIISDKKSKSFIDMLAKSFGAVTEHERDYTILKEEKLFKKVLIANRGEIALRVIRACRELGIGVVVIYSTEDKDSLAVKFADKAYCIGRAVGYLDIKKIIEIAKKAKVDAIHPGYGFLAENAKFAELCEKNKIKFMGPSSKVINLLGDKIKAKKTVKKAGVPILEGVNKKLKNVKQALKIAKRIGYPVILKAAAGGGGKGMRIVYNPEEMSTSFLSASSEAHLSFGDKSLYIEKYVENPRHIEFQVLADKYGNVIHLGERDCSIQRRHQKLIEETPSPVLSQELREQMGSAAIKVVSAVNYKGAGTVEFLLDKNKNFYFIEMNTRIQVEHGITEVVTDVDLIKEQIKFEAGAELAYKQDDIKMRGYAIECRINAEDPLNNFTPSIGTITNYLPPGGPGIRISSVCHTGYKISSQFDSLLALLICYGNTREEAIARMQRALEEYIIEGVETTIPLHKSILSNKFFLRGRITTNFIEKHKIIQELKNQKKIKRKEPTKEKKILVVTTAVSEYTKKKQSYNNKPGAWVMAGRQELMESEEET